MSDVRKQIGIVPQDTVLFNDTIRYISFSADCFNVVFVELLDIIFVLDVLRHQILKLRKRPRLQWFTTKSWLFLIVGSMFIWYFPNILLRIWYTGWWAGAEIIWRRETTGCDSTDYFEEATVYLSGWGICFRLGNYRNVRLQRPILK